MSTERLEQVNQLAQALLREYMHRKGYKVTLQKFDEENPRTEATISSRSVMNNAMLMDAINARNKSKPKDIQCGTFMELLCAYRLHKRHITQGEALTDSSDDEEDDAESLAQRSRQLALLRETLSKKEQQLAAAKNALLEAQQHKKAEAKRLKKKAEEEKQRLETEDKKQVFDPLGLTSTTQSAFALTGARESRGPTGRNWTPGGKQVILPEVGLGGSSAGGVSDDVPTFLAGTGMQLSVNALRATATKVQVPSPEKTAANAPVDMEPLATYNPLAKAVSAVKVVQKGSPTIRQGISFAESTGSPKPTNERKQRKVQIFADDP